MSEPDESFYAALARLPSYYPSWRWEWDECLRILDATRSDAESSGAEFVLLDVGCGSGGFLSYLRGSRGIDSYGVDTNTRAIAQANACGLKAFACELQDLRDRLPSGVDVVTLWHVLEHVPDPAGLLAQVKPLLRPGGRILFTVPLSPQFYEASWPDPLNQPPHHLTRWRVQSLTALEKRVGMQGKLVLPPPPRFAFRVLRTWMLQAMGPFCSLSAARKIVRLSTWLLNHPISALRDVGRQVSVARINGKCTPELALVELRELG